MSHNYPENEITSILDVLSNFKLGQFQKRIPTSRDPHLAPVIDKLNEVAKFFQAQAESKENIAVLDALVENIPVAVFLKDVNDDFRIKLWNKAAEKIFEIPKSAILGKTTRELWPKEQAELYTSADEKVARDGIPVEIASEPSQTKTRGTIYLHTKKLPLRLGSETSFKYLLCICNDITEQLNTQAKLREQATFPNVIANNIPGLIAYWTNEMKCFFANTACLEWLGKTPEQMKNIGMQDLLGQDLFQKNEPFIRCALRGENQAFEGTLIKPNGELVYTWTQYISHVVDDKVQGFFVLASDISPLKREEQKLRLSEAFNRSILNSVTAEIAALDLYGKIVAVNDPWTKFSLENSKTPGRASSSTGVGANYLESFGVVSSSPEYEQSIEAKNGIKAVLERKLPSFSMEYPCHSPNENRWFSMNVTPLLDSGSGVVVSHTNISDRKKAEAALRESELKLIHASRLAALGEMSAGVAHEINNPIGIIAGNIPLLVRFKNDEIKFQAKIDSTKKAALRVEKIVSSLKKFSRTSEMVEYKPVPLRAIILESLLVTGAKSRNQNVLVTSEIEDSLEVFCNEVEIEQVLINLISNGIDAVKDKSEKWVKIKAFKDNAQVVFRVYDSGAGVPTEVEQKLFQPFFTTKVVGEGTGLGLSICKGILEQHGASITLNRSFSDSCFEVRFSKCVEN